MRLKTEISKFWEWARSSPHEYSQNRGLGEWETEYPNWDKLNTEIDKTIIELNKNYETNTAELLIQGLAIDNESEQTLLKIEEKLKDKTKFIEQVLNSNQPQAKWQIAELLGTIKISKGLQYLERLTEESDKYVNRRALLSINRINKAKAKFIATKFVKDSDEYLKMVSNKIINEEINR